MSEDFWSGVLCTLVLLLMTTAAWVVLSPPKQKGPRAW